ncbi:MAG TPA: prealbumin-like fold domain-containing protein [Gemmatimonadaceae bacterium]
MQRKILARISVLALVATTLVVAACSNDSTGVDTVPLTAAKGTIGTGGTDSVPGTQNPAPPTSNGPVASVRVTPQTATVAVGNYVFVNAVGLDASGVVVANARAKYSTSNAAILSVVSDTGSIKAIALGTAKVYATIGSHTDSALVTVVAASTSPSNPTTPVPPAVASFDLTAKIVARGAGTDTSVTTPLPGALVKLTRTGGVTGDTLATAIDAGSATTDANGVVSFKGLTGGSYMVDVTPPAGSNLDALKSGFAPPRDNSINITFALRPKS